MAEALYRKARKLRRAVQAVQPLLDAAREETLYLGEIEQSLVGLRQYREEADLKALYDVQVLRVKYAKKACACPPIPIWQLSCPLPSVPHLTILAACPTPQHVCCPGGVGSGWLHQGPSRCGPRRQSCSQGQEGRVQGGQEGRRRGVGSQGHGAGGIPGLHLPGRLPGVDRGVNQGVHGANDEMLRCS